MLYEDKGTSAAGGIWNKKIQKKIQHKIIWMLTLKAALIK